MAMLWSRWRPFGFGANTNYNSMTDIPRRFPDFIFGKGYSNQRKPERFKYRIILLVREWPQAGLVPNSAIFSLAMPTSTPHIGLAAPYGGLVSPRDCGPSVRYSEPAAVWHSGLEQAIMFVRPRVQHIAS